MNKSDSGTKPCPHCKKQISKEEKSKCPECQSDLRDWPSRHPVTTVVGILATPVVIGLLFSNHPDGAASLVTGILVVGGVFFAYFLPSIIAHNKKKRNAGAVTALNLFLGWTLVGWIIALVWASANDEEKSVVSVAAQPASGADEIQKLAELKEKGILSEEEFEAKKQAILKGY